MLLIVVISSIGVYLTFGTITPFYVVVSGSMVPALNVYDILIISNNINFDQVKIGDIIVFNRPSDHDRVIVHRVAAIVADDPKQIRAKGDANAASVPGTDFPITEKEYIGTVMYTLPQIDMSHKFFGRQ